MGDIEYRIPSQEELPKILNNYDIVLIGLGLHFDRKVLSQAPRLKLIATATTGLDHIDTAYAKERGIEVLSLRGETEFLNSITSTAELAMGLMLDLARFTPFAFEAVRRGEWKRDEWRGHNLFGKTLGVVGLGRLGSMVAKYGRSFGMEVVFSDPNRDETVPEHKKISFDELLEQSDFISVHVPLSPETERIFRMPVFKKMKQSAYLVNTSRGGVIHEEDLLAALQTGEIAGYAADVLADELSLGPTFERHPLIEYAKAHRNVIIVPHTGGMTHDSRRATDIFIVEKLKKYLERHPVR